MQTSWYWFRTGPTRFSRWLSVVGCGYVTLNPFSSLATSLRTSEPVVRRRSGAVHGRRWTRAIETRQETKFSPRRRWVASRIATTQRGDDVIALKHDHRSTSWYLDALAEAQNWRNRGYRGQLSHVFRHWIIHCKMFQFRLQKASTYCLIGIELPKVTLILRFFYKFRFSRETCELTAAPHYAPNISLDLHHYLDPAIGTHVLQAHPCYCFFTAFHSFRRQCLIRDFGTKLWSHRRRLLAVQRVCFQTCS